MHQINSMDENKKRSGNPLWLPGKSGNVSGRPKNVNSVRTVRGMVQRFIKKNISPNRLQKMYDGLTELQKLEMLTTLLPYVISRVQPDAISEDEIHQLYEKLEKKIISDAGQAKKAG